MGPRAVSSRIRQACCAHSSSRRGAAERMGVSDVVARSTVSRSTLEMRFKRHLGRTVHDEIQRVRLDLARGMLTGSDLPLQAVAERSGFRTAHYLSAVFQREFGKPPGQTRHEGRFGGEIRPGIDEKSQSSCE